MVLLRANQKVIMVVREGTLHAHTIKSDMGILVGSSSGSLFLLEFPAKGDP